MLGRDLAHLVEEFPQGLAIVPQVALPGFDVEIIEVDLDLLTEGQRLKVRVVLVIDIEVEFGELWAQVGEVAGMATDPLQRASDGVLDLRQGKSEGID